MSRTADLAVAMDPVGAPFRATRALNTACTREPWRRVIRAVGGRQSVDDGGDALLEGHRARKAEQTASQAEHDWQSRHDAYVDLIQEARTFVGGDGQGILLGPGEKVYLQVDRCALVEERRGSGTIVGHSQGVSIPVAKLGGRQIRYRVGASKGHYMQGEPTPTAIDTGTVTVTSSRVVFQGSAQTRECVFAKLIGVHHDAVSGTTTLSVSNRKTPVTVRYGPGVSETFEFRLDLALAHFRGTVDELVAGLEADIAAVDAARPQLRAHQMSPRDPDIELGPPEPVAPHAPSPAPPQLPTPTPPAPTPVGPAVAAGWYPDPWGTAPLRWWDGRAWAWQTSAAAAPPVD